MLIYTAPITINAAEFFTHYEICKEDCNCCTSSKVESTCCVDECSYEAHSVPEIPIAYTAISQLNFNVVFSIIESNSFAVFEASEKKISFKPDLHHRNSISQKKKLIELISSQYHKSSLI